MKSLIVLFALVALTVASDSHNIEKRQTTVSASSRFLDAVSLTTVGGIIFALVILDIIVTVFFAAAIGGRSYRESDSWGLTSYFTNNRITDYLSTAYNSIDMVDTTFNVMDVDSEVCRKRAVCEVESMAAANPLFRLVVNTVNSNLRGLDRYEDAVEAGLARQDCALMYDDCQTSFLERLNFF